MKNIFEKNFQNFQQLPLPFNAIFPTPSKINEIHEDYKISASSKYRRMAFESLNDSKSRGGAIYFETTMDRSTRATSRGYAETMDRRARAKETRVHYCETVLARRVESVSPRANFSKPNRTGESQRTFLPSSFRGGKKFFSLLLFRGST